MLISAAAGVVALSPSEAGAPATPPPTDALAARGRYLAVVGDCAACHTSPQGGQAFAGGYPIQSPLGAIYSSNITPSKTYGIGNYSRDDFARALQKGIRKDGARLYPAMPYTSYAQLTPQDVDALYAYFTRSVKPVDLPAPQTKLRFPFNIRLSMAGWNALFLDTKRFKPDPAQSVEINRGRYLVEGLAHCDACHSPRNPLMATRTAGGMTGGNVGSWFAPNITNDKTSGIGGWSDAELTEYLKTGIGGDKARAAGPMAEAVSHSFQYMTDADIKAIVAYLRYLPAKATPGQSVSNFSHGNPADDLPAVRGARPYGHRLAGMDGEQLYMAACASCHQPDGAGTTDKSYPALFHNSTTGQPNPTNLIATILFGVEREVGGHTVKMPGFGPDSLVQPLDDNQVALIASHVLQQFGNRQAHVDPADVAHVREGGPSAKIALLGNPLVQGGGLIIIMAVVGLAIRRVRRRRRHFA